MSAGAVVFFVIILLVLVAVGVVVGVLIYKQQQSTASALYICQAGVCVLPTDPSQGIYTLAQCNSSSNPCASGGGGASGGGSNTNPGAYSSITVLYGGLGVDGLVIYSSPYVDNITTGQAGPPTNDPINWKALTLQANAPAQQFAGNTAFMFYDAKTGAYIGGFSQTGGGIVLGNSSIAQLNPVTGATTSITISGTSGTTTPILTVQTNIQGCCVQLNLQQGLPVTQAVCAAANSSYWTTPDWSTGNYQWGSPSCTRGSPATPTPACSDQDDNCPGPNCCGYWAGFSYGAYEGTLATCPSGSVSFPPPWLTGYMCTKQPRGNYCNADAQCASGNCTGGLYTNGSCQ